MTEPLKLYQTYGRDDVIARIGQNVLRSCCDDNWVILDRSAVCFCEIGAWPDKSHFVTATRFRWVGSKKRLSTEAGPPREVLGGTDEARAIYLLGRAADTEAFFYLGRLDPSYGYTTPSRGASGSSDHDLSPGLPSEIWSQLDPSFSLLDDDLVRQLDEALVRVDRMSLGERVDLYDPLLRFWFGDGPQARASEPPTGLPVALQRFHELASGDSMRMGVQNTFRSAGSLEVDEEGWIEFYVECQGVYLWAYKPGEKDPTVYGQYNGEEPWTSEGVPLSLFIIQAILFEGITAAPYSGFCALAPKSADDALRARLSILPLGSWRWPSPKTSFLGARGVYAMINANGPEDDPESEIGIMLGAKTEGPIHFLKDISSIDWDSSPF